MLGHFSYICIHIFLILEIGELVVFLVSGIPTANITTSTYIHRGYFKLLCHYRCFVLNFRKSIYVHTYVHEMLLLCSCFVEKLKALSFSHVLLYIYTNKYIMKNEKKKKMWNEMKKKIKINSPKILDRRVFIRNGSGLCNWGNALTGGAEIGYQSVINSKFNLCLSVKWLLWILYCLALRLLSYRLCYLQNANIFMLKI